MTEPPSSSMLPVGIRKPVETINANPAARNELGKTFDEKFIAMSPMPCAARSANWGRTLFRKLSICASVQSSPSGFLGNIAAGEGGGLPSFCCFTMNGSCNDIVRRSKNANQSQVDSR